ncbi:DUF350 domain-containing protein [Gallaecimonas sp. GXIMD4217]|uniref:DUF350 domain-containing protein n=1 Tax=Gallaecimonas sp. GXIMD4217 TaxID=3131927 RepID=UPI00311ACEC0
MNQILDFLTINQSLAVILLIDLAIAIALLGTMRFVTGWLAKTDSTAELASKDNIAFGISVAGSVGALGIMLTGAITGEAALSYSTEAIGMAAYGIAGLLLIKAGRWIHDKVALNALDKREQIIDHGNVAVALVDAASAIATAVVIRAVLLWAEGLTLGTVLSVLAGFALSQVLLVAITRLRESGYAKRNPGESLQQALVRGELAVAVRHAGQLIATALVVKAASHFLEFNPEALLATLATWLVITLVLALLLTALVWLARSLILYRIDLNSEVEQQHNTGIAAVEMAISIAIALILTALMV